MLNKIIVSLIVANVKIQVEKVGDSIEWDPVVQL